MRLTTLITFIIIAVFVLVSMAEFHFQMIKKIKAKKNSEPKIFREKKLEPIKVEPEQCPVKEELKGLVKEENYNYDKFDHIETPYEIIEEKCEKCGGVLKRGKIFYVCPVCGKKKKIL